MKGVILINNIKYGELIYPNDDIFLPIIHPLSSVYECLAAENHISLTPSKNDLDTKLILYILSGQGYIILSDNTFINYSSGDTLYLHPPIQINASISTDYFSIYFSAKSTMLNNNSNYILLHNQHHIKYDFIELYKTPSTNPLLISAKIYNLLMTIFSIFKSQNTYSPIVISCIDLINENYSFIEGIEQLADDIGVSKHHLIRTFSSQVGISPNAYLQQQKINSSKIFLQNRTYPIDVIASMVGFSTSNYFCKVFKKITSYTPSQYRKLYSTLPVIRNKTDKTTLHTEDIYHL